MGDQKMAKHFRLPAEWERHEATWFSWPHDLETWPKHLGEVEVCYIDMIEALHQGEKVHILVNDLASEEHVADCLKERGITKNFFIHQIETDSIWIRDYGPIFTKHSSGQIALTDWTFNAWGNKYQKYKADNEIPAQLAKILKFQHFKIDMVLEGGSIEANGKGTLLTTEECLLNPNRNPFLNRQTIEQYLKDFLGVTKIIWLEKGIAGDDTDGHIDEVARFVGPNKILVGYEENPRALDYQAFQENWNRLKNATDQDEKPMELIPVPMPKKVEVSPTVLPTSYTNFYVGNSCVLVPIFGDPNDTKALGILKDLFPARTVIGIPAIALIYGQGAIHCVTQQEPIHAA